MTRIVLDIETTGLSRYTNKLTEIAALKIKNNKVLEKYETLINPEMRIPSFITRLTGIDNEMVKDSPTIDEVLPAFKNFIGNHPLVAHSAGFDLGFLRHNFKEHLNEELNNDSICTVRLANRIPLGYENKKLGTLCEFFNIKNKRAHRAMGDTAATAELLKRFETILSHNKIEGINEIHRFSYLPAKKCREKIVVPRKF